MIHRNQFIAWSHDGIYLDAITVAVFIGPVVENDVHISVCGFA
jgi:hypothetical protein